MRSDDAGPRALPQAEKLSRYTVEPWGGGLLWLVNVRSMTDGDIPALAVQLGLMDAPGGAR